MAFNLSNIDKLSAEANTNVRRIFAYYNTDDTLAQIETANYFVDYYYNLAVGDVMYIAGSDGYDTVRVTAVSKTTVTVATFAAVPAGSITNNEVAANAAIAFSKLAALTSGNMLVGSAGGVATSVAMSGDATLSNLGALTIANNAVTSAKVSPLLLKYVAVPITAADFNGMYAAPKLLLAAGGANTLHVLEQCQLLLTYGAAAFAAGGTAAIQYGATINGAGVIASTTLANTVFQVTASTGLTFNKGVVAETFSTCVNQGLYLSNITGAFTTGDSNMVAHLWYKTIPTV